jgi:outer membrane protein assembly factor BamB
MKKSFLLWLGLVGAIGCLQAENWPRFRGPTGQGISTETGLPLHWSATSNMAWKKAIPGEGWSSPIVYANRVFVTTATDNGISCHVICLDRKTGAILWDKAVFQQALRRKEKKNSFATPTPVTDGQRVYAIFGSGSLVALDFAGSMVWTNHQFQHYSQHGLGVSPVLHEDLLIIPFDGSSEGPDKMLGWQKPWDKAVIVALDKSTGVVRWRAKRGLSRIAHVTPNILRVGGKEQLISGAGDVVQGFDLKTGELIWTATSKGEGVVPSVVLGDGLVFTASGFPQPTIRAHRTGGQGDVTRTHLAWEQKNGAPKISSFLYIRPHLYAVTDAGVATCLEAETGQIVWEKRLDGHYSASPVCVEGKIYFLSEEGETVVLAPGREFRILARNPLGEMCQASMAVSQKQFFIRTEKNLYCLGQR